MFDAMRLIEKLPEMTWQMESEDTNLTGKIIRYL